MNKHRIPLEKKIIPRNCFGFGNFPKKKNKNSGIKFFQKLISGINFGKLRSV